MTKKILAVLLSVAMVVSLLPATIFATNSGAQAIESCPITVKYGVKGHDLAACEEFEIEYEFIETVAPFCELQGYDLYRCACGQFFGDNLTANEHDFVPGEVVAEVPETCAADGVAEKIYCAVPGCTYFRGGEKIDNIDPEDVDAHTWGDAILEADCTKGGHYECEICDEVLDIEPAEKHVWDYDNYVELTPPTCDEPGEVILKCENCTVKNEVEIHEIPHDDDELIKVDAVDPDCLNAGNIEYYYCEVCQKNYILEQGVYIEVEDADDLIVPALGHTNPDEENPIAVVAPTCTKFGYTFYGCDRCGEVFPSNPKAPTGHSKYTENDLVSGGTCTVDAVYEWTCTHFANGVDGALCGEALEETVKAPGHTIEEVIVPATCEQVAYTFWYCSADNCDLALKEEATKDGKTFDLSVKIDEEGKVIDTEGEVQFIKIVSFGTKKDATNHKWGVEEVNLPTCTVDGNHVYFCVDCSEYEAKIDKAPGHTYDEEYEDNVAADCTTNAYIYCEVCEALIEQEGTKLAHKYDDTENKDVKAPQCNGTQGYTRYGCSAGDCGTMGPQVAWIDFEPLKEYATLEEAQAEHTATLTDKHEFRAPTCDIPGLWEYTCDDCEAAGRASVVLVVMDGTGDGHKGAPDPTDLTCTEDSVIAEYVCQNPWCGETIPEELVAEATGHDMTHFEAVPADCENDGTLEYWTCGNECCEGILYADEDGTTTYADEDALVDPATGHDFSVNGITYTVYPTCTRDGFTYYCCGNEGCDVEYADSYVPAYGHDDIEDVQSVVIDPTCEVDGSETWYCHCGEVLASEVIEAEGHVNADGDPIVNICTDETEDRTCVNNNCDYANNGNEVPKDHDSEVGKYFEATCIRYAYWLYACGNEGCPMEDHIVVDINNPAMGHRLPLGERYHEGEAVDSGLLEYYFNGGVWNSYEEYLENYGEDAWYTDYIPATYEAAGSITVYCPDCGHTVTYVVEHMGVDFGMDVDNAVKAGEGKYVETDNNGNVLYEGFYATDSGFVALTIDMSAYMTNVWGFNFDVYYNACAMDYVGYVWNSDVFATYNVVNHIERYTDMDGDEICCDYVDYGYVSIVASTENDLAGDFVNAEITGTTGLVTLYFQISAADEGIYEGDEYEDWYSYGYFEIYDVEVIDAEDNDIWYDAEDAYLEIIPFMDLNWNGDYSIRDVMYAYEIAAGYNEDMEYFVGADIDKDGDVDIKDVSYMYNAVSGYMTYEELWAVDEWTRPEGFVAA